MPNHTSTKVIAALVMLLSVILAGTARADVLVTVGNDTQGPPTWSYTLDNTEPTGSPNYLSTFTIYFSAPITVTGTPAGWNAITDNSSYVYWYNADQALPYPNDVAPGASLGGFSIDSQSSVSAAGGFLVTSWDHSGDVPGPFADGSVQVPFSPAAVPEPSGTAAFAIGAIVVGLLSIGGARTRKRTA